MELLFELWKAGGAEALLMITGWVAAYMLWRKQNSQVDRMIEILTGLERTLVVIKERISRRGS